jgi:meiotic recombination protein DMC1
MIRLVKMMFIVLYKGCFTVESVLMRTKKELCNFKGLSEAKVDKIFEAAGKVKVNSFFI